MGVTPAVALVMLVFSAPFEACPQTDATKPAIRVIDPPEKEFFSKVLDYHGIPIKAHSVVSDEAIYAAYDRLNLELKSLPVAVSNLAAAGAELHIIGRNQVTTDLPEWRHDKHVPLDEYNGLTRDQRTRGMGGRITSCGEENLLRLPKGLDRYFGRDICLHEFAHNILGSGLSPDVRARIEEQARRSKEKGLWINSYAGSNTHEFFAELTMWYFGTHGDLSMTGPKPEDGPQGLEKYDPEAFALLDDLYSGRIEVSKVEPRIRPETGSPRAPRDSLVARAIVARLAAYRVDTTTLADFYADAGMNNPDDKGQNGWYTSRLDTPEQPQVAGFSKDPHGSFKFRVFFRDARSRDRSLADLEFKAGLLIAFKWNN